MLLQWIITAITLQGEQSTKGWRGSFRLQAGRITPLLISSFHISYISQLLARGGHHTAGQQRSARPSCPPPPPPPHHPLIPCVFITSSLHCPAYICCSLSMPHTLYVMYNKLNQKQDLSNVRITDKVPTEPFLRSLTRAHRCRSEHWLCFFMYPGPGSRQLHWFCPETHK